KDDADEAQFMLQVALKDASLIVKDGAEPISGDALAELARQYIMADSVIGRLARHTDMGALSAMAEGVEINLDNAEQAEASAQRLFKAIDDPAVPNGVTVNVETNEEGDSWRLVVNRMHHGNVRVSIFDRTFVRGGDYAILAKAAQTFHGLMGVGALVARGEGERRKEKYISDFREAMQWL